MYCRLSCSMCCIFAKKSDLLCAVETPIYYLVECSVKCIIKYIVEYPVGKSFIISLRCFFLFQITLFTNGTFGKNFLPKTSAQFLAIQNLLQNSIGEKYSKI